uniref:Lipase maturation factor 1 n=1 Tax=Felis catus TaxID=9685 RepID=A0ABI7W8G9_FELCA
MAAPEETLRRRKAGNSGPEPDTPPESGRDPTGCPARLRTGTFWLTRIVLLRALAFIYFVAFLVALHQNKQLIGDRGLLPCRAYLESVRRYFQGRGGWEAVSYAPTVLWLLDWSRMNANLDALALLGLGVSSFVLVTGCANMVLMATLWVLYMSLVNVGQIWWISNGHPRAVAVARGLSGGPLAAPCGQGPGDRPVCLLLQAAAKRLCGVRCPSRPSAPPLVGFPEVRRPRCLPPAPGLLAGGVYQQRGAPLAFPVTSSEAAVF